jgi:formylglycine-generating enzyme required for sulfatase activity
MKTKQIVLFPLLLMFASCSFNAGNAKKDSAQTKNTAAAKVADSIPKGKGQTDEKMTLTIDGVDFTFVKVKGGSFYMGSQKDDPHGINYDPQSDTDDCIVHKVTLSDYWIGETEITQKQWKKIVVIDSEGLKPDRKSGWGDNYPMYYLAWIQCMDYAKKLSKIAHEEKLIKDNQTFSLPTDAQWEYAARGGVKSRHYRYSGSNDVNEVAWNYINADGKVHPVATKKPNELGIYDMSGNVSEWCSDSYRKYGKEESVNPIFPYEDAPRFGNFVVLRWGNVDTDISYLRVSSRIGDDPGWCEDFYGFRLVLQ